MKLKPTSLFLVLSLTTLCGLLQAQESPQNPPAETERAAEVPRSSPKREEPAVRAPSPESRRGGREAREAAPEVRQDQPERRRPEMGSRDENRQEPSRERFQPERGGPTREAPRDSGPNDRRDEDRNPPRDPRDMNRLHGQEGHSRDGEYRRNEPSHRELGVPRGREHGDFHRRDQSRDPGGPRGPEGRFELGHRRSMHRPMHTPRGQFDAPEARHPMPPMHHRMPAPHPTHDFRPEMGSAHPHHRPESHHPRGPMPEGNRHRGVDLRRDRVPQHRSPRPEDHTRTRGDLRGI